MHATHSNGHTASAQGSDLAHYIDDAKALARTHFDCDAITHEWAEDPESGERWIVVRADVRGSVESVLAAKREYTSRWVASVPAPQRFAVRLSLNFV